MRRILTGILFLALLSPAAAARRTGLEVKGGVLLNVAQVFSGYLNIGPRVDVGYYDHWFYVGGRASYLYSDIHDGWNLRAGVFSGWRSNFTLHELYVTALVGAEYNQAPWDALPSGEGLGPSGVFSITLEPGLTARVTDWLSIHVEVPIAFPLGHKELDPDIKGFLYVNVYWY
ncbi:MAG: hypothetical protein A2Y64_00085 [Candidatus Coatesbacteria bacterium RBG_13_66_14]|uniref:Outer membrane protein beta-barrel domain-containing protein n=1 Tax=Candidatus Coatesbacteria bacterium RBG_13_66_14 TaxID=1817816 RepID=A0A1F5FFC2_9BACT|nr:MAG: hypothetical protein A2Y64_00085 [Candidatus Coatesbacteria bacterium RBG_13_66_14]